MATERTHTFPHKLGGVGNGHSGIPKGNCSVKANNKQTTATTSPNGNAAGNNNNNATNNRSINMADKQSNYY